MSTSTSETTPVSAAELAAAVLDALSRKGPALTVSQVRDHLPRRCRLPNAEIERSLEGLAAEGKVHSWPPYRSKSKRYGVQPMEAYARTTLTRLLSEHAFTQRELIDAVREEVPGVPEEQCEKILEEVLAGGHVRKLPPRVGSNAHLLGTPHPRAYLAPLFETLLKGLDKLYVRLESEGVPRTRVLEEAKELWQEVVREAERDLGAVPAEEPESEPETPPAFRPETAIAQETSTAEGAPFEEPPGASAPPSEESPEGPSSAPPETQAL
jgi:hypothetical protein